MMKKTTTILLIVIFLMGACTAPSQVPAGQPPALGIITHPDGLLYAGDQVSFEVVGGTSSSENSETIQIILDGKVIASQEFALRGIGARRQATFLWVWDTHGLPPGEYSFTFSLQPGNLTWQKNIKLLSADQVPLPEPGAQWQSVETTCCIVYYISATDAANNLAELISMVNAQAAAVEKRFGAVFNQKIPVTFLPRTLGHGGFASDGIYVSYLRRNYAGSTTQQVVHHEMVHWMDNQLGGELRPSIFQEGLAVYASDGHFKLEPIIPRAAAILDLGLFLPLRTLSDSFYRSQHELGYAEAAALIAYLVSIHGWEAFDAFYRDIHPAESGSEADAIDEAVRRHFNLTYEQLEQDFKDYLRAQTINQAVRDDVRLTVDFYNTVRNYQQRYDPSAYFLTAWLPDVATMRSRGIVADFVRHPDAWFNLFIEGQLLAVDTRLRSGDLGAASAQLGIVNFLLSSLEEKK